MSNVTLRDGGLVSRVCCLGHRFKPFALMLARFRQLEKIGSSYEMVGLLVPLYAKSLRMGRLVIAGDVRKARSRSGGELRLPFICYFI